MALTTGFDLTKCRHPIVGIHRDGIKFALQDYDNSMGSQEAIPVPPQLDFLEVISEFSFRLLPVDRMGEKGMLVHRFCYIHRSVFSVKGGVNIENIYARYNSQKR